MPSRTGKPRSHSGCDECKQRRVKCDETLPVCRRCQRNGRPCSRAAVYNYCLQPVAIVAAPASAKKLVWKTVALTDRLSARAVKDEASYSPSPSTPTTPSRHSLPRATSAALQHWLAVPDPLLHSPVECSPSAPSPRYTEQELLDYYVHETAGSLAQNDPDLLALYQKSTPMLARDRDYLRDCILAMAGHHILFKAKRARLLQPCNTSSLEEQVIGIQSRALHVFSAQINVAVATDDCVAVCLAGIMVMLSAFAGPQVREVLPLLPEAAHALAKAKDLLRLLAGIATIVQIKEEQLLQSDFGCFMTLLPTDRSLQLDPEHEASLKQLQGYCASEQVDEEHREVLLEACRGLQEAFRQQRRDPRDMRYRLGWVQGESASALADLLEQRRAGALMVVAFWGATLVHWPGAWWELGFGRALIAEVHAKLPQPLQSYVAWPLAYSQTLHFPGD